MSSHIQDKNGQTIEIGDEVWTPLRGGKRQGAVEKIVMTEDEAKENDVKNPPKVIFTDQKGKKVAHNPDALQHVGHE